jgi:hypothetical protein
MLVGCVPLHSPLRRPQSLVAPLLDPGPRKLRPFRERADPQTPVGPQPAGHEPHTPLIATPANVDVVAMQVSDPGVSADAAEPSFHAGDSTG